MKTQDLETDKMPITKFHIRQRLRRFLWKYRYYELGLLVALGIWYAFCLPRQLFQDPVSTVLVDRNGQLLGARIAKDGQWRFPTIDSLPSKVTRALITFEDKRFYDHWGVDPAATGRALYQNVTRGEVVSGGSTLSMQVIRLSRKGQGRTYMEKLIEMILATRMEIRYDKEDILRYYLTNAPFGGNVVGVETASWKYYGRSPHQLSWAEAATLAVLPNAPSLIHPGKNRIRLREKRDRLLDLLQEEGHIDSEQCRLAKLEPLPDKPLPLPSYAPHLLERIRMEKQGERTVFHSTIDVHTQERVSNILQNHVRHLKANGIYNASALVVEVKSGDVLAYVGNGNGDGHGYSVDMITAPRSSGSILKPLLYACALDDGTILPKTLLRDTPTDFSGYTPKNFNLRYEGAVPADDALARSLNVPAARLLSRYGQRKFYHQCKEMGMNTLHRPSSEYGLALILGGAETCMEDLGRVYSGMARSLLDFTENSAEYQSGNYHPLRYELEDQKPRTLEKTSIVGAGAIWSTFEAMTEVSRPGLERFWTNFSSTSKIAWKTGTSFGFRDAWAVGVSPQFVVVVWAGNADGEGRPELIGAKAAGPILFDIFHAIDFSNDWFEQPYDDMTQISVCNHSGHRATDNCSDHSMAWVPSGGTQGAPCPYCQLKHLDEDEKWQVSGACYAPSDMVHKPYFVLPPVMEHYYRTYHPNYEVVPEFAPGCNVHESRKAKSIELIYPSQHTKIFIPIKLDETASSVVFEATHRETDATLYWHLDEEFVGTTTDFHQLKLNPDYGKHKITLVDGNGESVSQTFEVVSK